MELENYIHETKREELMKKHTVKEFKEMYLKLAGIEYPMKSAKKETILWDLKLNVRAKKRGEAFAKF